MKKNELQVLFTKILLLITGTAQLSCAQSNRVAAPPDKAWSLTGQEILLEISDPRGTQSSGIYALDPSIIEGKEITSTPLRLLVKNASRPVWSPRRKRFAYLFNDQLWISDLRGDKVAIAKAPPTDLLINGDSAVRWAWDGTLFYSLYSPASGSQTVLGFNAIPPKVV